MPHPTARRVLLALILMVSPFVATASDAPVATRIPADADILITDGRGVIVGVGEADAGTTFRLSLVDGFSGAATLIFVLDDGSFQEIEVVIDEGGVSIGDRRLGDLVADAFADVAIGPERSRSGRPGEAIGADEAGDPEPVAVPPVAGPPAVGAPEGAGPDEGAPDQGAAPSPPSEADPPEGEDVREPAETGAEPPVAVPSPDRPSTDDAPGETPDDAPEDASDEAPDRGRP